MNEFFKYYEWPRVDLMRNMNVSSKQCNPASLMFMFHFEKFSSVGFHSMNCSRHRIISFQNLPKMAAAALKSLPFPLLHLLLCLLYPTIVLGQYVDMRSVAEGNCPYGGFPVMNIDKTWFETAPFRYIIAGSKYHLYRIASDAARFSNSSFVTIREHEFPDTACLEAQIDRRGGRGAVYSRGFLVNNYLVNRPDPNDYRLIDFTPVPQPPHRYPPDVARHYVVLTDNETFVMFANCWTRSYQKSWDVLSTVPYLSTRAMDMIEFYIHNLGFNRRLALFLKFDRCPSRY